ncbi:unnamed protein product [Coregonus sp. 'balchen']|nr:unnamed protein product [Coregonus sp. 'balchen']
MALGCGIAPSERREESSSVIEPPVSPLLLFSSPRKIQIFLSSPVNHVYDRAEVAHFKKRCCCWLLTGRKLRSGNTQREQLGDSRAWDQLPVAKCVPWTGWVYRNVKQPESVSDHMYRMSMMALTITDHKVNKERCMKLALVHDMAECIVGDIVPADNVGKAEKQTGRGKLIIPNPPWCQHVGNGRFVDFSEISANDNPFFLRKQHTQEGLRKEIYELWEEYESQSSTAKLVKEFDLLEMILQVHEYKELDEKPGRLQEFFASTQERVGHMAAGVDGLSRSSETKKPRTDSSS